MAKLNQYGVATSLVTANLFGFAGGTDFAFPITLFDKWYLPSVRTQGAVGDGVSDDSAGVAAAASLGKASYNPPGTYLTTLTPTAGLPTRMFGEGIVQDSGNNKRARYYSRITAAPSSLGNYNSIETAFNGDWSKSPFPVEHRITGVATLGQPNSGYVYTPEAYPHYGYLFNSSGWNNATGSNSGRTAAAAYRTQVFQSGQGDAVAYNASGFVNSTLVGSTIFLANPAAVLFNGDASAGIDGAYLNLAELSANDGGFDVAAAGYVVNLTRVNVTGAKSAWWAGFRAQSKGAGAIDTFFSAYGPARFGLDLSFCDFSGNSQAAISLKVDQRIYGNVTATDASGLSRFPSALNTDYISFSSGIGGWIIVAGNQAAVQITSAQVGITRPFKLTDNVGFYGTTPVSKQTVTGAKGGNAALTSLMAALVAIGIFTDTTS